ncbi:hypothetical protein Asi03nite_60140 [Actinoplanes siamensis]|uniref:Uncharacterized protein n=1 Tax=Actinoplanes siamensis TaxID=1223317 RepID=A0A919NCR4_9ACTN|nr:hypothetical protein Asi03nite_60140 [Actinoplanes siamensis]
MARVPAAWARQVRPGGIVLANIGFGVVPLVCDDQHTLTGRLLPGFAGFMEARTADGAKPLTADEAIALCCDDHEGDPCSS